MMRARHLIPAVLLLLLAVVAALAAGSLFRGDPTDTIEVRRAPLTRRIDASGELRSAERVTIGSPAIRRVWNFTVTSLAEEGIAVAPGTPLISFDTQKLRERLEVLSSRLDTAKKELEKTTLEQQGTLDRFVLEGVELKAKRAKLVQQLDVPEDLQKRLELEKLRIDADLAEVEIRLAAERTEVHRRSMGSRLAAASARVRGLETDVAQVQDAIQKMTVRAPSEGFVVHVTDWRGNKVKVGESVWHGRQIIELADLGHMEVTAEVAEPDAGFVEVGQPVEIRLDASPERLFTGRVEKLGRLFHPRSAEDPAMVFDAIVSIEDADPELMRPGMAAKLEILSESGEPVIQLPESAIREGESGPTVSIRQSSGEVRTVPVSLGPRWRGTVVVTEGLEEGVAVEVPRDS